MAILSHGHQPQAAGDGNDPEGARLRTELGRFLLENLGLNGTWSSYVLLHPERGLRTNRSSDGTPLGALERWLLDRCPIILATQERFRIARSLTQPLLRGCLAAGCFGALGPGHQQWAEHLREG